MNTLSRHYVGQGDACGQHSHAHFTSFRLGALLFNRLNCIRPAVVGDDNSRVFHKTPAPLLIVDTD
jgi:hypothetical protein